MALSYGIQPLPITKALELYDLLGEYLPEFDAEMQVLDFVGTIVNNAVADESTAIVDALRLMANMNVKEIADFSVEMQLKLLIAGLIENDIVNLVKFCKDIGYGR